MVFATFCLTATPVPTQAAFPFWEIVRQGVKRVIRAVDLMVQRLQNKTIALQNVAKVLENKLSKLKLHEIAEWTDRQRQLYKRYYDELWRVRSTIATYKRIKWIVQRQQQLFLEYQYMRQMIRHDKHFSRDEVDYMSRVYAGILGESIDNLNQILVVVNSYRTKMSDAKRLKIINEASDRIEQNYADLRQFNNQNIQLSLNRAKDQHEIETVRKLYGLN